MTTDPGTTTRPDLAPIPAAGQTGPAILEQVLARVPVDVVLPDGSRLGGTARAGASPAAYGQWLS